MSKDELLRELLAERYGKPVKQYKPKTTAAPVAELLDVLRELTDDDELHLREVV